MMARTALFISRAGADAEFAAVIGGILEEAGHAVTLQQWDFANRNFMERMHAVLAGGARVVALLSPEYLRSEHCQAEWQNAIAGDPLNTNSRLILLRVAECEPVGLLSGLAYWDLVPIRENRALLEEIVRGAVREERQAVVPTGPYWRAARTIVDTAAIRSVPNFSGREEELAGIAAALGNDASVAVVHGLGGVGKSSVAREFAWRNREQYSIVWWVNAASEEGIVESLLRLGALFVRGLDRIDDRRIAAQQVVNSVLAGFSKPVLLIFDNLEDERLLHKWMPRTGSRALATSRNAAWEGGITPIALQTWDLATASDYMQRQSGRDDLTQADAAAIADALGGLPLAISHAAASLRTMRMVTPQRYLAHLAEHLKGAPRGAEYPRSVFATFNAAIVQAEVDAPGAAAVLAFAASFAPDAIPDELFREPAGSYAENLRPVPSRGAALDLRSAVAREIGLDAALGALDRFSLLAFAPESRTYSMHRLVQLAARDLVADSTGAWRECAVAVAGALFPAEDFTTWALRERLIPHVHAALDALPREADSIPAAGLASRAAMYLCARGEYAAAEQLASRALTIRERMLGPERPEVAESLNELADIYSGQGRYAEVEALHTRALTIRERALGPDHSSVAYSIEGLAAVCRSQARFAEAEAFHARALAIWQKTEPPEYLAMAYALNNLAVVYRDQGRYADALPLLVRALAIREEAIGREHPEVAETLNNLAVVYRDLERYTDAEPVAQRALAIKERAYGSEHPSVAYSLNSLAFVYRGQGRYAEAEPLCIRALAIREKMLGREHPDVAYSLSTLASLYCDQSRYAEAEALHARALAIRENALGPEHPNVALSLNDLAIVHRNLGRSGEAARLLRRALEIQRKGFGDDHSSTKATREALAAVETTG